MAENKCYDAILERLQDKIFAFMDDVRRRTRIFEGRRSVEEQLSEEYHGRFLIELIQNADDACGPDEQIFIVVRQGPSPRVVVFNTGRGFTPSNFESLCTLGLTDKKPEEAIGNKGLGFRSVLEVCKSPVIYSSDADRPEDAGPCFDGYCFCFSPDDLTGALRKAAERTISGDGISPIEIAGKSFQLSETTQLETLNSLKRSLEDPGVLERACKTLPAYEMPIPIAPSDPLLTWAASKGAATAVSIEIIPEAEGTLEKALSELNPYTFLFLRNAQYISIYIEHPDQPHEVAEFKRIMPHSKEEGEIRKGLIEAKYLDRSAWAAACGKIPEDFKDESQGWLFMKKLLARADFEESLKGLPERWQDIKQIEAEIAVPIGADNREGKFSIYLPTLAKTGTGAWVNAPFYGKIDRTSINWGHKWNSCLLDHAVACIAEMVTLLFLSPDIESGQAILHLLGIKEQNQALAQAQISSESIKRIVKEQAWVLCEPDSKGRLNYAKLSDIVLPKNLEWEAPPVEAIMEISCREQIPLICPHVELIESSQVIIENTAKIYGASTKEPTEEELARLAEIAIQKTPKNKQDRLWWNTLYKWLGLLDISYDALVGKRLIWTQAGIYKVERESRIFSPPRRLAGSGEEDNPMIKKFQEVLTSTLPEAFQDRVAFLHPEIDLDDKYIRSFLIREYRGQTVVMQFRTKEIVEFILNHICLDLYRPRMSKKRRKETAEVFAWTFVLWMQMRGEGLYVDWNQLLVPTTIGWQQADETYAGRAWTDDDGSDLEQVFQDAEPPKPFLVHPKNLIQMLPKTFKELILEYDLEEDLKEFILDVLKAWTAPRIIIKKAARPGGIPAEFCPTGWLNSLDTSPLRDLPEKHNVPIDKEIWNRHLQRMEQESEGRPFQKSSRFVLEKIAYIEELKIPVADPEALARCLGRGWDKYYKNHAITWIERHPSEGGERRAWSVTGFVVEQLRELEWIPMSVWATRIEEEREISQEFGCNVKPSQTLKVSRDILSGGSAVIYSLLPHVSPDVEQNISEDLCQKVGITPYSPIPKEVQKPFHTMELIFEAHSHLPNGREHFLLSLWQDLFDAAVLRFDQDRLPATKPGAVLGFEVQKDRGKRLCWLRTVKEDDSETYTTWVNDNDDCLSMLPPGTLIVCTGNGRTHFDSRVTLLKHILQKANIRRLSELKAIPEFDLSSGWETPRLLSDAFPWLISPALAVLAFGRQTSQPMSVSNPKGEFQGLVSRIQGARVQYVRNLRIKLEGLDVIPEPRRVFYSPSENLLLLETDSDLRLRDLSSPLTLLFDREDYLKPSELWLRKVEEASGDSALRKDVPSGTAIKELEIDPSRLQELFQVIGGETQQIIRSVAPALFAVLNKGKSPLSAQKLNSLIAEIVDRGKPYDLGEEMMATILAESGILEPQKYGNAFCQIVEQTREPAEIAKRVYELLKIDLGDWNTAAQSIGAREQVVANQGGIEAFNKVKQDTRWAACGFLQTHLKNIRKEEFSERWDSYDSLKPSERIHQTWSPSSLEIESPVIEWFKAQAAELLESYEQDSIFSGEKSTELLEFIRNKYLGKDPDAVCSDNVKALNLQWARLRLALACLAIRSTDSEAVMSHLRTIDEGAPGQWIMENGRLQSRLSVTPCTEEELFALLREWISTQALPARKLLEGSEANTLDEFVKSKKIQPDEEKKAVGTLAQVPKILPKQTVVGKSLEVPEKEKPLDELRKKLDELLRENNQEMLKRLAQDVDIDMSTELGDAPVPHARKKPEGRKAVISKSKDVEFIGYVGEYLIYRALKRRYPHIGLSNWVSGNKQRFFPGSKGDDSLGYDFSIPIDGRKILIEVKSHTGDQSYFELGSSELDAAQEVLETGDIYQVWVIRNLEGSLQIDHIANPMERENRKHFRFEVGKVYYQAIIS